MNWAILIIAGLVAGHGIHRSVPYILGLTDKRLPTHVPWVELTTTFLLGVVAYQQGFQAYSLFIFTLFLMSVIATDMLTQYISPPACLAGTVAGLVANGFDSQRMLLLLDQYEILEWFQVTSFGATAAVILAAAGAAMGFLVIEFIRRLFMPLVSMEVMGSGDRLVMLMIGAWVGPRVVLWSLLPACLIGILFGGVRMLFKDGHHLPFGPALALGSLTMVLYGRSVLDGIAGFQAWVSGLPPVALLGFTGFLMIVLIALLFYMRRKAAVLEKALEDDYREIDKKFES